MWPSEFSDGTEIEPSISKKIQKTNPKPKTVPQTKTNPKQMSILQRNPPKEGTGTLARMTFTGFTWHNAQ